MKKILLIAAIASFVLPVATTFAASTLVNGGLGQSAVDQSNFGLAVCNHGKTALTDPASLTVTANGQTVNAQSAAPISAGACAYTNVSYAEFNMQAGQTYDVSVSINGGASSSYSVTMPGSAPTDTMADNTATQPATADVSSQSGNFFANFWHWFVGLF